MVRIVLGPLGWIALRPLAMRGAQGWDDGIDPTVIEGGMDPAHVMDGVRAYPVRGRPERISDDVEALLETARVVFRAGHDLAAPEAPLRRDVGHDAFEVVHGRMLFAGRAQRGLGRRRHGRIRVRAAEPLEPAARAHVTFSVVRRLDRIEVTRHRCMLTFAPIGLAPM